MSKQVKRRVTLQPHQIAINRNPTVLNQHVVCTLSSRGLKMEVLAELLLRLPVRGEADAPVRVTLSRALLLYVALVSALLLAVFTQHMIA